MSNTNHDSTGVEQHHKSQRKHVTLFSNRFTFILAAAASAIGLGNLWRFPSLAAKYGGGAFLLVYLLLVVTFGFTLMVAEIAIGRRTGKSAIDAFRSFGQRYAAIGVLTALVPVIITPYYCVIGGWISKYLFTYLSGGGAATADGGGFFSGFIATSGEPLGWTALFVVLVMLVVGLGVEKGIEKLNGVVMPMLLLFTIGISIYALTIPGALDGLAYYIIPHLSDISIATVVAAMGQMFFSLSLAMGIMITYGSYTSRDTDIEKSVRQIEIADTALAFICGLMIIPAVFAFSGVEGARQAGPGLLFITLPQVFAQTGFATVLGAVFFFAVFFAALTSAISLAETVVSFAMDRFGLSRRKAALAVFVVILLLAIPPTLGFSDWGAATLTIGAAQMSILDVMDFISNSVLMPLVALLVCLFVGWWRGPDVVIDEVKATKSARFASEGLFKVMIRWVAPLFLLIILISSILNGLGVVSI
ncbi:MAG: sodium-dependent transporter [Coriobacteriales bacterium]|jgi:NSS family neurotransmitter:Na+ symporter|nr:sodium-dependent transporter [Coriobacteriales bacterium]